MTGTDTKDYLIDDGQERLFGVEGNYPSHKSIDDNDTEVKE